jgi:Family of unknown function (DUF6228)
VSDDRAIWRGGGGTVLAVMYEAVVTSTEGRQLRFARPVRSPDEREPWSYDVSLAVEGTHASVNVWDYGAGPAAYFQLLADNWKGWDGDRSWSSLEGQLNIDARHDGKGLIICEVTVGSVIAPTWSLTATLTFGAGAHMDEIAATVARALI